ncbi:MAG: deoxyribonuclease IV [Chloroflexota bacterium]|nr:deoxyribonuclease IV [Dehalococcoidia bacterium]MDW8253697.1 deoxyribonuclease IV [Chloroflexota bacterium]
MQRFGAHVGGGLARIPDAAAALGAECVQIFTSAPQNWRPPRHDARAVAAFREAIAARSIHPVIIHGIYLLNPASADPALVEKSILSIVDDLEWADRLGACAVVIHLGSSGADPLEVGVARCADALGRVLRQYAGSASLLLETCAGQGNTVGRRFEELGYLLERLNDERAGVCLDTCHVFAAGYDIASENGFAEMMADLDRYVGRERVRALHVNDSKGPLGCNRDRHENIGRGHIGEEGFRRVLRHPAFAALPLILEVPGLDNRGPDRANLQVLRALAGAPPLPEAPNGALREASASPLPESV